jgi:type I restriction enzyme S subunit
MKKYPECKPSGIEWIGQIPDHWEVWKVKFIAKVKGRIGFRGYTVADLVEKGEGALTLGATHIDKDGKIDLSKPVHISWRKYYESPEIMVETNDILVVQRGSIGVVGIVSEEIGYATINPSLTILKKVKMNRSLLFFQLRSTIVKEAIKTIVTETAVPMLSQNQISNFNILIPTLTEQYSIVRFLNHKTGQMDRIIDNRQKQIELLKEQKASIINKAVTKGINPKAKMKPSGIEWIGEIPDTWAVWKLKFLTKKISKGTTPSTEGREILEVGEIRFLKAENITPDGISSQPEFFIDRETNKILKRSQLQINDILFVIAGATIGKAAILKEVFIPANTNQAVCFIRLKKKILPELVLHQLQSSYIKNKMALESVVAAQPNISMEDIGNFQIFLPPIEDQESLYRYLKEETSTIDSLISKYQKQIDLMQEYRTSLISQAVTGKIDVRDWQPKEKAS